MRPPTSGVRLSSGSLTVPPLTRLVALNTPTTVHPDWPSTGLASPSRKPCAFQSNPGRVMATFAVQRSYFERHVHHRLELVLWPGTNGEPVECAADVGEIAAFASIKLNISIVLWTALVEKPVDAEPVLAEANATQTIRVVAPSPEPSPKVQGHSTEIEVVSHAKAAQRRLRHGAAARQPGWNRCRC